MSTNPENKTEEQTKNENELIDAATERVEETAEVQPKSYKLNINQLYDLKGLSGLFILRGTMEKARMAKFYRITDGKEVQSKYADARQLGQTVVTLNGLDADGKQRFVSVPAIIEKIFDLYPIQIPQFSNEKEKAEEEKNRLLSLMSVIVPDYEEGKFKHYHMRKIIGWATEIKAVHDLMEVRSRTNGEDPIAAIEESVTDKKQDDPIAAIEEDTNTDPTKTDETQTDKEEIKD